MPTGDPAMAAAPGRPQAGFTLIELLVVLAIVALLAALAMPRYLGSLERARQRALAENLRLTREAIDHYYEDHRRFPDSLQQLVDAHYLRALPMDPILDSDQRWRLDPPEPPDEGGVADLHSTAPGADADGHPLESL